jgi:Flp pilus assembly protein TadG
MDPKQTSQELRLRLFRNRAWSSLRKVSKDIRGLATIEFGMIVGFLAFAFLNVADVSAFLFDKLQVNEATQMGAQAAWAACDLNHVPATTKCPSMNGAVTTALQSTSLGNSVTLVHGFPSEGFYCVNSGGNLQYMADVSSPPTDCSAAGNGGVAPADYVEVQTTYTYTPIFGGASVASLLPSTITSTSWVRLAGG